MNFLSSIFCFTRRNSFAFIENNEGALIPRQASRAEIDYLRRVITLFHDEMLINFASSELAKCGLPSNLEKYLCKETYLSSYQFDWKVVKTEPAAEQQSLIAPERPTKLLTWT